MKSVSIATDPHIIADGDGLCDSQVLSSAHRSLFQFFLSAQQNEFSEEYIHLKFDDAFSVRRLLELMIVEYASPHENT